ncbi:putative Dehydrodolichyl diphosphate synthase complex subunit Dhdds [Blattamonas nauphoetae]|uniref:Alkyl transferase n=1 Tax=Blattamonas nauphoetae TaxID=2049346 RepID=A0ABQ9XFA9_9EUKA|nr:putative Dehydrodolichyl diphosphate synthase complex subunit Dhdds [Blattamonas nauphoetae]
MSSILKSLDTFITSRVLKYYQTKPIPNHIAVIMDGNRRWSKNHSLSKQEGHKAGYDTLFSNADLCFQLGVHHLTAYAFSADNFTREQSEVDYLMTLANMAIKTFTEKKAELSEKGIRLTVFGDLQFLLERYHDRKAASALREKCLQIMEETKNNSPFHLNICFCYSSRHEMQMSAQSMIESVKQGKVHPDDLSYSMFSNGLYTAGQPAPDLLIRTSGETRLSDFLLSQSAFTLLHFVPVNWPDFTRRRMLDSIRYYLKHHDSLMDLRKSFVET